VISPAAAGVNPLPPPHREAWTGTMTDSRTDHPDASQDADTDADLGMPADDPAGTTAADEEEGRASAGGPGIGAMGVTTDVEDTDTVLTDEERNP
jgi:hypothetical protein